MQSPLEIVGMRVFCADLFMDAHTVHEGMLTLKGSDRFDPVAVSRQCQGERDPSDVGGFPPLPNQQRRGQQMKCAQRA